MVPSKPIQRFKNIFNEEPSTAWAGYILGAFYVLLKEGRIDQFPHGATIVIKSNIPIGGGVASSAAIEVATLMALNQLYNLELDAMEIAHLAQIVENRVAGAPCGIMDQVTAVAGTSTKILLNSLSTRQNSRIRFNTLERQFCRYLYESTEKHSKYRLC